MNTYLVEKERQADSLEIISTVDKIEMVPARNAKSME